MIMLRVTKCSANSNATLMAGLSLRSVGHPSNCTRHCR